MTTTDCRNNSVPRYGMIDNDFIISVGNMPVYTPNVWDDFVATVCPSDIRRFVSRKAYLYGDSLKYSLTVHNKADSETELVYVWMLHRVSGKEYLVEQGGGNLTISAKGETETKLKAVYLSLAGQYVFKMRLGKQRKDAEMASFTVLDRDLQMDRRNTLAMAAGISAGVSLGITYLLGILGS